MAQGFWERITKALSKKEKNAAVVCDASDLNFDESKMSRHALQVAKVLHENGHPAYLVGGCVRDVLLGKQPKDFDVATEAHPGTIRALFRNSRIIGRRFQLVHIYFRDEIIEVSTFRGKHDDQEGDPLKMVVRDNQFGSLEEDAWRRDLSINSLYYDPSSRKILDFTGGLLDINKRTLRMIGDVKQRFHEDPVRMLRAIRFQAKLGFKMEANMASEIRCLGNLLMQVPSGRLFDENLKFFYTGHARASYDALRHFGCFTLLYPEIDKVLQSGELDPSYQKFLDVAMKSTDRRIQQNLGVNPGFLLAVMLWAPFQFHLLAFRDDELADNMALKQVMQRVIKTQIEVLKIPKRFSFMIQDIWFLQYQMMRGLQRSVRGVAGHRFFRAAVDFLEFRVEAGEPLEYHATWWRAYCDGDVAARKRMIEARFHHNQDASSTEPGTMPSRKRRRPRRKAKRRDASPDKGADNGPQASRDDPSDRHN